jgi:hypothetical protein
MNRTPAAAAAADAGTGAVEKMNERARFTRNSINALEPQMYPPEAPTALPNVPI